MTRQRTQYRSSSSRQVNGVNNTRDILFISYMYSFFPCCLFPLFFFLLLILSYLSFSISVVKTKGGEGNASPEKEEEQEKGSSKIAGHLTADLLSTEKNIRPSASFQKVRWD